MGWDGVGIIVSVITLELDEREASAESVMFRISQTCTKISKDDSVANAQYLLVPAISIEWGFGPSQERII